LTNTYQEAFDRKVELPEKEYGANSYGAHVKGDIRPYQDGTRKLDWEFSSLP
jgi:hypothetical protein